MAHAYGLDEQGTKLAETAARVAAEVLGKHAADVDRNGRFPSESVRAIADAGLMGLCLPAALGGHGQAPRTFATVVEELALRCGSSAMIYVMHVTAAQAVASSTSLAGKEDLLRNMAAGKHLTTLAFSEKGSRSNFWAPVSKLTPKGSGFTTNAFKSWVTAASHADSYVASAQKPDAASPLESTCYLVRKGQKGVRVSSSFDGLGLRGNDSAALSFEDVEIGAGDLLTAQGAGAKTKLEVVLPWFVVGTSAMANGLGRAAVSATAEHLSSTTLEHMHQQLRDLPTLRARLAEMSTRVAQSRAHLGYTVGEMEKPDAMTPLHVLTSRHAALDAAIAVTDGAMKACGGAAFSRHLPVERLFRDARAGWVMAPTSDHLADFIGKALTGLPLF